MRTGLFINALIILVVTSSVAWSTEKQVDMSKALHFKVEKFKLDNGLTVLLHEDHRVPIISYHQWFRVGSSHEKPGRTGLAHFFEHLMFKGTKKYGGRELQRMIQANGGTNNAFTSRDYTGYFENMPSGTLDLVIDLESDRMRNLIFDQKEIQSEREVVKEERRYRVDNNVYGLLDVATYKAVFKVHPYRRPIVGSMRDLNAASMEDLKEFYRTYYAPNNAVVVIAGAFDSSRAKKLIKQHYGSIPAQKIPETKFTPEPEQMGHRSIQIKKDVQNATVAVVFKSDRAGGEDSYALDLLSTALGSGDSSRLHKRLVYREQSAMSVSSWNYTPAEPGVFQVIASVKPGVDVEKVLTSIYAEIYKVRTQNITEKELQKAKNSVMMSYVKGLQRVSGRARALANAEILFGDYSMIFKEIQRYNEVSLEDIQNVAKKYLKPTQRSVVRVVPKNTEGV